MAVKEPGAAVRPALARRTTRSKNPRSARSIVAAIEARAKERAGLRAAAELEIAGRLGTPCPHGAVHGDPCAKLWEQPSGYCPACTRSAAGLLSGTRCPLFGLFRRNMTGDATQAPLHFDTEHVDAAARAQIDGLVERWLELVGGVRVVDPYRLIARLPTVRVASNSPAIDSDARVAVFVHDVSPEAGGVALHPAHQPGGA